MDIVFAFKFVLARADNGVNSHIVLVPYKMYDKQSIVNLLIKMSMSSSTAGLPDNPGVRPATDGAVQTHTLFLPHGVGARLNHKLWRMHQAVFVHALKMRFLFMDLQRIS